MSENLTLTVTGMTCGGCERAVTGTLLQADGVTAARASHQEKRVDVTFDPTRVDPDTLKRTIEELGYTVLPGSTNNL